MVQNPKATILTYNLYEHEDKQGCPCHGLHDTSGETRSFHNTKLSRDIISYVGNCFCYVLVDSVSKMHIKKHVNLDAIADDRDLFLSRIFFVNIYHCLSK